MSIHPQRRIGPFTVPALGFGCMNLSHAYGVPLPHAEARQVLLRAVELGFTFFDTAALYSFGSNEELVGEVLAPFRSRIVLASKCGLTGVDGKRTIDGRPEQLRRDCEASLRRLKTEVIDLYYLHRWDKRVPIEDSIGALAELVQQGKIRTLGLSEVSAATLRRAHRVHPIVAVQNEYSLWTRNPEIGLLQACQELGVTLVAFSPLARGFLTGDLREVVTLEARDIRRAMPRFEPDNYRHNLSLLDALLPLAAAARCTPAQLALAWLLHRGEQVLPLPGTTSLDHLEENWRVLQVQLDTALLARIDQVLQAHSIRGERYNAANMAEIDTENF